MHDEKIEESEEQRRKEREKNATLLGSIFTKQKLKSRKAALKSAPLFSKGILHSSASSFQSASRSSSHREAGARGVRETSARETERERERGASERQQRQRD